MSEFKTFVVLEGQLHENMEFKMLRSYETTTAPQQDRFAKQDTGISISAQLLDDIGEVLVVGMPQVRFPSGCSVEPSHPGLGLLHATLALHPNARKFELRAHERLIFSAEIGVEPPPLKGIKVEPTENHAIVQIRIDPAQPQVNDIQFFLVDTVDRRFPLTSTTDGEVYLVNLLNYAGRENATIHVEVTRDFRTAKAISPPVVLPPAKVYGRILEPADQSEWCAGISGSLIANLFDDNGRAVLWDSNKISWVIDGKTLNDSRPIALCRELEPGDHSIELRYRLAEERTVVLDQIHLKVCEKTEMQKKYDAILADYFAGKAVIATEL
jgi:hypothetical protein